MIYTPDEALHVRFSPFLLRRVSSKVQRRQTMSMSVEDLVASLNASHIGQEAIDLAALQVRTDNVILRFPTMAYLPSSWCRHSSLRRSLYIKFHLHIQIHPTRMHMLRTQTLLGVTPARPLLHAPLPPLSPGRQATCLQNSLESATIASLVPIPVDQV